ncbi:MAG: hypothetical protein Q8909_15210 [Bacteroidota bacterium]|nr:hypothetical protein [Bacteroidota bacterium]
MKLIKIKLTLLILSASTLSHSQTFEEAKANFDNKHYLKAKEQFSKILKAKKDPLTNQYYTLCQAQVAYTNYQFDESVLLFKKCADDPKTDTKLKAFAEKGISSASVASRQIRGVEKVQIIDSMVVDKQDFLKTYQLSSESGSVMSTDHFFGTSTGNCASVYQNQLMDKIYFAEKSDGNNFQLYTQNRLLDSWSEKTLLPDIINTKANENFPYVLTDGTTLYFASDGEGSIGGYDIFITRYNLTNNSYLAPENVGMPFNSIYNDYMMVIDEQNNIGWFASDRYQPEGKVVIYLFIPNESKQVYENETPDRLIRLAQLRSIKETWKKGANYQALLDKIKNTDRSEESQTNSKGAFRLVINDNQVYHSWNDFKNEEAKAAFKEAIQTGNKLQTIKNQLHKLREEYLAPDQTHREEVSNAILTLEKEVEELQTKQADLKLKAINLENQNLR